MSMSRKDYEALAAALHPHADAEGATGQAVRSIAYEMAKNFAADNPRFDTARFLIAAGVIGGTL